MSLIAKLTPDGSAIARYPLYTERLGRLEKQVSFPREPSDETLAEYGYVRVQLVAQPTAPAGGSVVEDTPEKVGDIWQQAWTVLSPDAAKIHETKLSLADAADNAARHAYFKRVRLPPVINSPLMDIKTRIMNATTIEEASAIADEATALEEGGAVYPVDRPTTLGGGR